MDLHHGSHRSNIASSFMAALSKGKRSRKAIRALLVSVATALSMLACGDEDSPTQPSVPSPTLDNIWPNDDLRFWTFELTLREWIGPGPPLYMDCDSVAPAPSLLEVAAFLESPDVGDSTGTTAGFERLQFDGMRTTESGASGQNLVETLFSAETPETTVTANLTLLGRIYAARPDLRAALRAHEPRLEANLLSHTRIRGSVLLHGGAWEKTESYIGGYGDIDALLAWKYLEANLEPGQEFTLQLIPSLTNDVFLHGRVHRRTTWETRTGTYVNALECVYMIDYGVSDAVDGDGNFVGCWRSVTFGTVVYAPTVGPVYCYEWNELAPNLFASFLLPGRVGANFDVELDLLTTGLPAVDDALTETTMTTSRTGP